MNSYRNNRVRRTQKANNFILQGSILAVASILVRIIGLIYRIPMVRILGDEGMGYYEYAFEIYNFCFIISSYGMPMAVSKLVADRHSRRELHNSYRIFWGAMFLAVLSGGILSLLVYSGAAFISTKFFENPAIQIPLRILAPTILISAMLGVIRGFFQGKGTMVPTAISQLLEQIVNGVVSVVAAYELTRAHSVSPDIAAYGAAGGVTGTFIGAFFGFIFMVFVFVINFPLFRIQNRKDTHMTEPMPKLLSILILTIVPVMLSQILSRSNSLIAMTMFNKILDAKGLPKTEYTSLYGIYGGKYILLCNIILSVTNAITAAMIPSLVRANAIYSRAEVNSKINLTLKFNLILAIPSAIGLSILGGPIIRLLFKDDNPMIANTMLIGSIAIIFYTVSILFNTIIQSIDKMSIPVIHSVIAIILDIPLLWALLTYTDLNIYALVIGNIFMPVVVILLDIIYIKRRLNIRFHAAKTVIIPTIASMIMGIIVFASYSLINNFLKINTVALFISIFLGMFSFFLLEIKMKGISGKELEAFPKGGLLIRLSEKLHLM